MLSAIERIELHAPSTRARFERDELVQIWVVHHLQIMGESASRLSSELRSRHPEIPWAQMIALRNILVHDYFRVNVVAIWVTLKQDLPRLKIQIAKLLQDFPGSSPDA